MEEERGHEEKSIVLFYEASIAMKAIDGVWFIGMLICCCDTIIIKKGPPIVVAAYQLPNPSEWTRKLKIGYEQRIAADPSFPIKSATEVLLAAGTQLTAEWNRRGADRLLQEIDFVVPAILSAVFGKYVRYCPLHPLRENDSFCLRLSRSHDPESCQIIEPRLVCGCSMPIFLEEEAILSNSGIGSTCKGSPRETVHGIQYWSSTYLYCLSCGDYDSLWGLNRYKH